MANVSVRKPDQAWRDALLSLLVPGLGQLRQDRPLTGIVFLAMGAIVIILAVVPILFAWFGHRMDVSPAVAAGTFVAYIVCAAIAAFDAYSGSGKRASR